MCANLLQRTDEHRKTCFSLRCVRGLFSVVHFLVAFILSLFWTKPTESDKVKKNLHKLKDLPDQGRKWKGISRNCFVELLDVVSYSRVLYYEQPPLQDGARAWSVW